MNFVNEGPNYQKGKHAYDINLVDALTGEKIALYIGYYNSKTKKLKLYPYYLTDYGKLKGYKMEVKTVDASQVKNFE